MANIPPRSGRPGATARERILGAERLQSALGSKRLAADADEIRRLVAAAEQDGPYPSGIAGLEARFHCLLGQFRELVGRVVDGGPQRDAIVLFAWVRQSLAAVCPDYRPDYRAAGPDAEPEARLFRHFVAELVLLVVIFDDITETAGEGDLESLLRTAGGIIERGLGEGTLTLVPAPEPFPKLLTEDQRRYVQLADQAFALHRDTVDELCPDESLGQAKETRERMDAALRELFAMVGFARAIDRMVRVGESEGEEDPVPGTPASGSSLPDTEAYIRSTRPSTQMKHMLLASFLLRWGSMTGAQRRLLDREFGLRETLDELAEFGDAIDSLGTMANDIATVCREVAQRNTSNSVLIEALNEGDITASQLQSALARLEEMGPEHSRRLLSRISRKAFASSYPIRVEWGHVNNEGSDIRIDEVLALANIIFAPHGAFDRILARWQAGLEQLRERAAGSPLARLIDLEDLANRQERFLLMYAAANDGL